MNRISLGDRNQMKFDCGVMFVATSFRAAFFFIKVPPDILLGFKFLRRFKIFKLICKRVVTEFDRGRPALLLAGGFAYCRHGIDFNSRVVPFLNREKQFGVGDHYNDASVTRKSLLGKIL